MYNIPLVLTLIRLTFSPLVFPFLLFYFWSPSFLVNNFLLAGLFAALGITDCLDGYLARKYSQETALGRDLDPIADKFLLYSVLVALLALNKVHFFWVIVFIGRELFVMGLRIVALENKFRVDVSRIAKLKTMSQMIFLTFVIMSPTTLQTEYCLWSYIETTLLFISGFLTVFSAYQYTMMFKRFYCKG